MRRRRRWRRATSRRAEQDFRDALAKDPANAEAGLGLGRILADRGELDAARRARDAARSPIPRPSGSSRWSGSPGLGRNEGRGTLASAKRLAATGRWREALDGMLGSLRTTARPREPPWATSSRCWVTKTRWCPSTGAGWPTPCSEGPMADVHDQLRAFWDRDARRTTSRPRTRSATRSRRPHGGRRSADVCPSRERRCSTSAPEPARSACSPPSWVTT